VKGIGLPLQDALRAPAHDHATPFHVCLLHNLTGQSRHHFGVKATGIVWHHAGRQRRSAHGLPVHAAKPGICALVKAPYNFSVHVPSAGNGLNQFAVQQRPAQPLRNDLCNSSATASKLP
jgi:hypothetical protein